MMYLFFKISGMFFVLLGVSTYRVLAQSNGTDSIQFCTDTGIYILNSWDFRTFCCELMFSNQTCPFICPCVNGAVACEVRTQTCSCRDGYKGNYCEIPCKENFRYGSHCIHKCHCGPGAYCDPVQGICSCLQENCQRCEHGKWGPSCTFDCDCGFGFTCDMDTGSCSCKNFTHCSEDPEIANPNPCDCHNGGKCSSEGTSCWCQRGWIGERCSIPCPTGLYGPACQRNCSCGSGAVCNSQTGICLCIDTSQGYNCPNRCPRGYFGPFCRYKCDCPRRLTCNAISGNCDCQLKGGCVLQSDFFSDEEGFDSENSPTNTEFNNNHLLQPPTKYYTRGMDTTGTYPSITVDPGAGLDAYLMYGIIVLVIILLVIVMFLFIAVVCKRQKIKDMSEKKRLNTVPDGNNDYEDLDDLELDIRQPRFYQPPLPSKPKATLGPTVSLPPIPAIEVNEAQLPVSRRVKSLMASSNPKNKAYRNSYHARTSSLLSNLSIGNAKSIETLPPLPKSIESLGITNEMLSKDLSLSRENNYELADSKWTSMPSVPNSPHTNSPVFKRDSARRSLIVAPCDEYEDYADPFETDLLPISPSERPLTKSAPSYNRYTNSPLQARNSRTGQPKNFSPQPSRNNDRYSYIDVSQGYGREDYVDLNASAKSSLESLSKPSTHRRSLSSNGSKSPSTLYLSRQMSDQIPGKETQLLQNGVDDDEDYADPSDSVTNSPVEENRRLDCILNDASLDQSPIYFTLEQEAKRTGNHFQQTKAASVKVNVAKDDSDYDELEEEPISNTTIRYDARHKSTGDSANGVPHSKTFSGVTNHSKNQYYVLERNRKAQSERTPSRQDRAPRSDRRTFTPLQQQEEEGIYSHLQRVSVKKASKTKSPSPDDDCEGEYADISIK